MSLPIKPLGLAIALALLITSGAARATVVTFTMDEVATQPIDGLTVSKGGISVTYSDPGGNLFYNAVGPGQMTYVQDPSIVGAREPFSVSFSQPVTGIQFGFAEDLVTPVTGEQVLLSNGTLLLFNLPLTDQFAEGQFTYSGPAVTGFTVTPVGGSLALSFDDLQLAFGTVTTPVPEPESWAMMMLGLGLAGAARRRQSRTTGPAFSDAAVRSQGS